MVAARACADKDRTASASWRRRKIRLSLHRQYALEAGHLCVRLWTKAASQFLLRLVNVAVPDKILTEVANACGHVVLANALAWRLARRGVRWRGFLRLCGNASPGLVRRKLSVEGGFVSWGASGLHYRAGSVQDDGCLFWFVVPVMEIGPAVDLDLEPEVDPFLVLSLGAVPEQLVGGIEGGGGGVVAVVLHLDPPQPGLKASGLQPLVKVDTLQSLVENFSCLAEATVTPEDLGQLDIADRRRL